MSSSVDRSSASASAPKPPATPEELPSARREAWRSPAGISAIAAAVTCVLGLLTFVAVDLVDRRAEREPAAPVEAAPNVIFVYGSSMPGQSRYAFIEHLVENSRAAEVPGYLYDWDLGYPLAKFGPGEVIPGYVLTLRPESSEEFFTQMTQIEAGLFELVEVTTRDGIRVRAYEWIGPTDGLRRIARWEGQ